MNDVEAQINKAIEIGKYHTIKSKVLEADRIIQIYLASDYEQSGKKYPVLYILDSQWHFTNAVAIQDSLRLPGLFPEMIASYSVGKQPLILVTMPY